VGYGVIGPPSVDTGAPPASAAELAARWAAISARQREVWWPLFASNLLYLVGMLVLVPLGLALRARLGGGARQDLAAAGFGLGGALGALQTAITLGLDGHTAFLGAALPPDATAGLIALAVVNGVVGSITYWLLLLFLLLVGLATYRAGQVGREQGLLPDGLGRLTRLVAAVYGLAALAHLLAGLTGVPGAADVYQLAVVAGGAVLAPIWALRLGRALHRPAPSTPAP
jgi:hypothetical protein